MIPFMASGFSEHVKPDEESLRLEIIERKIMKIEDDDDSDDSEIEKLLRERHALKRKLRIRALEKELGQLNKPNKEDKEEEKEEEKEEAHA